MRKRMMRMGFIAVATTAAAMLIAAAPGARAQDLNDAQIVSILMAVDQVEIDAGNFARATTTRPEVRQFAERMIVDHAGVNMTVTGIAGKLKFTPQDNPSSQSIKAAGASSLAALKALKSDAFDKAYIDQEVAYHSQLLDTVDKTLLPGVKNDRLKALLGRMRLALAAHLEHATMLQASMK